MNQQERVLRRRRNRMSTSTQAETQKLWEIHAEEDLALRARLIEGFIADLAPILRRFAGKLSHRPGLGSQREDILQEISVLAFRIATEWPDIDPGESRFEAVLYRRSVALLRDYANSSKVTGMSGASTAVRRERALYQTRAQLQQELMRDPSDDEVVDSWNQEAKRRYSDPGKAGLLAKVEDLDVTRTSTTGYDPEWASMVSDPADEYLLSEVESADFLDRVRGELDKCVDARLIEIINFWFDQILGGEAPTAGGISTQMGVPYERVRKAMRAARVLALSMLGDADAA